MFNHYEDEDYGYDRFTCPECSASYYTDGVTGACEECGWTVEDDCYTSELDTELDEVEELEHAA